MLALAMIVGVVFTHGGACAAVELAESNAAGTHAAHAAHAAHGVQGRAGVASARVSRQEGTCLHRRLPVRHQHGTEQGCSAFTPANAPVVVAMAAIAPLSVTPAAPRARPVTACAAADVGAGPENLCVMRI